MVKVPGMCADTSTVRFDLVRPTSRQLRDGVTCGIIAESIMVPILLTMTFLDHRQVRWGYLAGAVVCIVVSIGFQVVFSAVTRGRASVQSQANSWFIIACLALAGLPV